MPRVPPKALTGCPMWPLGRPAVLGGRVATGLRVARGEDMVGARESVRVQLVRRADLALGPSGST